MGLDVNGCASALSNAYDAYKNSIAASIKQQQAEEEKKSLYQPQAKISNENIAVKKEEEEPPKEDEEEQPEVEDFIKTFNRILDTYSQMAEPEKNNVSIITSAGSLDIKRKDDPTEQNLEIATKYMAYWALCIAPIGIPETLPKGGTIVTVMNDATSYVNSCKSDLDALAKNSDKGDPYVKIVDILFGYAKKIQWTVTEQWINPSGSPTPEIYTVKIK